MNTKPDLEQAMKELGEKKIGDIRGTKQAVGQVSRGLMGRYVNRYFMRKGGSIMPLFHAMVLIGAFGYACDYSHLSKHC